MTAAELAQQLNGLEYPSSIPRALQQQAKDAGLVIVIVYGPTDDLVIFSGAIDDEDGPGLIFVDRQGVVSARTSKHIKEFCERIANAARIEAVQYVDGPYRATVETNIPHATWDYMTGATPYGRGIVFALSDLTTKGAS